ncbi:unnamed protein product [Microthlaspi erraticum]|uniref:F-box associated beta-propeller type 1 domain-containing protein n=1 Tax=Microthlaspi erraticum TaxID=1685480 RepID=A0A6D2JPE2_9BRAS|nr:unnamed protein product [Microthlaspi erraticum]
MFTDLPRELEWEILSRVPPTCLNIDIPADDVNLNLHGINNNKSFDSSIEFTGKPNSLRDSEQMMIHAIFQCEGLFLCTTKDKRIVVWNPCTGQTRWIRSQPGNRDDLYALGY